MDGQVVRPGGRRRLIAGLVLAALMLGSGLAGFGVGRLTSGNEPGGPLPPVRPPSLLGVPDTIDETLEDAGERLVALQFDVGFRQPPSGQGTGRVAAQDPPPGEIVERGSLVVLIEGRTTGAPVVDAEGPEDR